MKITAIWQNIKVILDKVQKLSLSQFPYSVTYADVGEHQNEVVKKTLVVDKVSKLTREAYFGAINYIKMFKEGIMMNLITDSPVSLEYKQCYLCSSHGLFIG